MIRSALLKSEAIMVWVPSLIPGSILGLTMYREDKSAHKERKGEEQPDERWPRTIPLCRIPSTLDITLTPLPYSRKRGPESILSCFSSTKVRKTVEDVGIARRGHRVQTKAARN